MHADKRWLSRFAALSVATVTGFGLAPAFAPAAAQEPVTITGVTPVEAEVTVPSGTPLDEALARLPSTTTITLSSGDAATVTLNWRLSEYVETSRGSRPLRQDYFPTARGPWEATGTFELPAGVRQAEPPVALEVTARFTLAPGPLRELDDRSVLNQPGTYRTETMTFGDVVRTYHTYVPSSYDGSTPTPVMFTFHGGGSYAVGQLIYSEFDRVAEERGFMVVAPDYGANARGSFMTPPVAEFTSAIIDRLTETYNIDARRIYASGISMGGGASITLAHELGHRIAAVAPVATSARNILNQTLPRPTTFVLIYGDQDSGYGPDLYRVVDRLVEQNRASTTPEITTWAATDDDPTSTTRFTYGGGAGGTEVIFYRVEGGGHTWPGKYQYASIISVGPTSQHIDATEMIWEHLSRHTLPAEGETDR